MSSQADEESLMSSMLINMLISMLLMSSMFISMLISMLLMSSMLISMVISMLLLSSLHCDSYIKVLVVPQAQMMYGHHRVRLKMIQCPDCGKEFTRKFNMERHRILSHGDSNSEADSEESFDHSTEASDEQESSEQDSIAHAGDNDDGDDSDRDEDDDGDSSSDSQNSTDDEDEDDDVWSSIRDISWTSKLLSTFNEGKKEYQNQGMTANEDHQEAYQHVLPKLGGNIMSNYVGNIVDSAKLHKDPVHKKIMSTKRKKAMTMKAKKWSNMLWKRGNFSFKRPQVL